MTKISKIDEVSERIGQLTAEVRTLSSGVNLTNKHIEKQNGRITRLERFDSKLIGAVIVIGGVVGSIASFVVDKFR